MQSLSLTLAVFVGVLAAKFVSFKAHQYYVRYYRAKYGNPIFLPPEKIEELLQWRRTRDALNKCGPKNSDMPPLPKEERQLAVGTQDAVAL